MLAVTQLLFTAVFSCDAQAGDGDGLPCPVAAIAALSAAKSVPAASIAAMLHHGIRHRDASRAAPLLRLPGAKQIGSQKLCIMLEAAVRAKLEDAAWELGRCALAEPLSHCPARCLSRHGANNGWCCILQEEHHANTATATTKRADSTA